MNRKLWGLFSGTHLTIMFAATMGVMLPGALRAVDAFTTVAIEDPISGVKAYIDSARRFSVYNLFAAVRHQPWNLVHGFGSASGCSSVYTVPAGSALIVQSMTAYMHSASTVGSEVELAVYSAVGCTGSLIAAATSDRAHETVTQTFGSGVAIPSGRTLSAAAINNNGSFAFYGYLVPASWVPANTPSNSPPPRSTMIQ